jgi:thioredoxin-related protein
MSNLLNKLNTVASIAVIIVAVLLGYVLVKDFILQPNRTRESRSTEDSIKVGTKLSLPDVNWQQNGRTVFLALKPNCPYCNASVPFYRKLSQALVTEKSGSLVALFPKAVSDGPGYLNSSGVVVNEVKQVTFETLGIKGTPTIIIADKDGSVVGYWFGQLSSAKEEEVLKQLRAGPAS